MAEGHIYIYGEIIPWQDEQAGSYGGVNLKDVSKQMQAFKDADELIVHVHSPGGDVYEGFAIHDALTNSGKKITTVIEGLCASIATVIALAGETRKITENSQFMIHNPWGMAGGESEDIRRYADQLEKEEKRLADFYAKKTGQEIEDLKAMMKGETWMTANEAKEKGFITEIITELKAVAKINLNKNEMDKEFEKEARGFFAKFNDFFEKFKKQEPKALVLTMAGGEQLDFGEEVAEVGDIVVGTPVRPADDEQLKEEYQLPDGTTLKVSDGKVSEIVEVEEEPDEMQALKDEIAKLKEELATAKAETETAISAKAEVETQFNGLKEEVTEMKKLTSDMKDLFDKEVKGEPEKNKGVTVTRSALS